MHINKNIGVYALTNNQKMIVRVLRILLQHHWLKYSYIYLSRENMCNIFSYYLFNNHNLQYFIYRSEQIGTYRIHRYEKHSHLLIHNYREETSYLFDTGFIFNKFCKNWIVKKNNNIYILLYLQSICVFILIMSE